MSIPIGTIGSLRPHHVEYLDVWCVERDCRHHGSIEVTALPDNLVIADLAKRLICSRCGSRWVDVRPRWPLPRMGLR